jgi:tetratricopeptide (TPR) repeat protein
MINYFNKVVDLRLANNLGDVEKILYNIGLTYAEVDNYPQALEYFNRAITANPKFPPPYVKAAYIYNLQQKHDMVIKYLSTSIQLDPTNGTV